MSVDEYVKLTLKLLEKERNAETEETRLLTEHLPAKELQRRGVCLLKLHLTERRTGLYGHNIAVFQLWAPNVDLPAHNLMPGDIVGVSLMPDISSLSSGIVSRVWPQSIQVAFEESVDIFSWSQEVQYRLTKLANDITYKRLKRALHDLHRYTHGPSGRLISVLFGVSQLSAPWNQTEINWINKGLDESQQGAVHFALAQPEVAVIHGPPGTGKTTTLVEIILQAVHQGLKVLALAPSNVAVDNMVERLSLHHKRIVRIGHPARLLPHVQHFSLDALVAASEQTALVGDVRSDLEKALSQVKGSRGDQRAGLREDLKHLRKELRQREDAAIKGILQRADIVLVTLTSASHDSALKLLQDENHFQLVVIDECSQALEAACWMGLLHGPRCILAGDPLQLPPTIISQEAAKEGLGVTLMEKVMTLHGKSVTRMLTTQYRMHTLIMQWPSEQLYEGRLQAHQSVAHHLLRDLPGVEDCPETSTPLLLVDTAGCGLHELDVSQEVSKGNEGEADIVVAHIHQLIKAGVSAADIAVIAPYNLQVELLRQRLSSHYPNLEIKSVDGFQGREKEAVVLSFVRSNDRKEVGFLSEKRRINVAITRARRHLAVVCDSETVGTDNFLKSLLDFMSEKGEVWSAHEYLQAGLVQECSTRPEHLENLLADPESNTIKASKERNEKLEKKQQKSKRIMNKQSLPEANIKVERNSKREALMSTESKQALYEKVLGEFLADSNQTSMTFSSSLTSHDRMVIHQVAESLGLLHMSSGDGKDRQVVVFKLKKSTSSLLLHQIDSAPVHCEPASSLDSAPVHCEPASSLSQKEKHDADVSCTEKSIPEPEKEKSTKFSGNNFVPDHCKSPDTLTSKSIAKFEDNHKSGICQSDTVRCIHCMHDIPLNNLNLHESHCVHGNKRDVSDSASTKATKKTARTQKSKPCSQVRQTATVLQKLADDDFDTLIATVMALDSKCSFKKCKTLTNTLGRNCMHCSRRFCLQHLLPEVHGCGDAARIHAHQTTVREGVLYQGSGVPSKKPSHERRAQLEHKLNKKLGELTERRTRKDKDNIKK